jgi:hypothetical protein
MITPERIDPPMMTFMVTIGIMIQE